MPFLFLGFVAQSYQWWALLKVLGYELSVKDAFISTGLPIFGKYIPGKLWIVLGKSTYVANKLSVGLKEVSWLVLLTQALSILASLFIGVWVFLGLSGGEKYLLLLTASLIIISVVIFNPTLLKTAEKFIQYFLKRRVHLPHVKFGQALKISPYFLITWLSWSIGFYFLAASVDSEQISLWLIPCFPLAASLGIMTILAPGGLGVREGILVGLTTLLGFDLETAVKLSIMQRIWYLFGEAFIFLLALFLNKWKMSFNDK